VKTKIGIYPAAFDPVHKGHLAFAHAAKEKYGLDKIYFLPEPNPKHKQGVKALEHRTNMVHLAIANEQDFGVIALDVQELDIRHVWPLITSRFLGSELFMLIGNNPVKRLAGWPHTTEFGKQAPTFVVARRHKSVAEIKKSLETLLKTKKLDLPYEVLDAEYQIHSSPAIRIQIKQGEKPDALPHAVVEYILRHKLYISGAD
jgi:nicotinate-nucleotide adenylyltransferase